MHFSPFYRDFILKVINNSALKIVHVYESGFISTSVDEEIKTKFSKKKANKIYADIRNVDSLPHELGHAVDYWFSRTQSLSTEVILSTGKTLEETFNEEFSNKHKEIFEMVMNEYKEVINSNINDKAFDILKDHMEEYRALSSLDISNDDETIEERKKLQKRLYKCGFVEVYYQLLTKKCNDFIDNKYEPILDALSSRYNLEGYLIHHHAVDYYRMDETRPVREFFANLFAVKVTSKHVLFDHLIKHLPKSFEAFEELFSIFYEHIQNNKRFTDVKLRRGIN